MGYICFSAVAIGAIVLWAGTIVHWLTDNEHVKHDALLLGFVGVGIIVCACGISAAASVIQVPGNHPARIAHP